MAAYPTVTRVLQGGNVNQVLGNGFIISGTQPSLENFVGLNNIRLNKTIVTVPKEYEVTSVSDKIIIKYPVVGGQNVPRLNFNQNNNILSTSNISSSNVAVHSNGQATLTPGSSNLHQLTGNVHDSQATKINEGTRYAHQEGSSSNVDVIAQKGPCRNDTVAGTAVILNQTQPELNGDEEKIGNLKIHMSEGFLPGTIVSCKGILDLNFMRNLFEVTNVDVNFINNVPFEPGICDALKKIINNHILQDWLMLKCEEKQIQFFKVNDKIEIYSKNCFKAVMNTISEESSLPLPFITKDAENNTKYYYINFRKGTNDKVNKLNFLIFYDVDNGRKKLPCKHPGIRLDCNFETSVAGFTIHVHKSTAPVYKHVVSYIRQLIIYSHIVWGFLQSWILNVREHHNNCFSATDISKNLILNQTSEMNALTGNDDGMMYFIGYSNFYLKFDVAMLKETYTTFSIENFEMSFTCDVPIVEYYRQFILINDVNYSDALRNVTLFSKKNQMSGNNARDNNCLPRRTNPGFKADCFQPTLSSHERQTLQSNPLPQDRQNLQPNLIPQGSQNFQPNLIPQGSQNFQPNLIPQGSQNFQPNLIPQGSQSFQPNLIPLESQSFQPNLIPLESQSFQPNLIPHESQSFQQKVVSVPFTSAQSLPSNEEERSGGVAQHFQSDPQGSRPEMENNCTDSNIGNGGNESERPETNPDVGRPGLTKPLIKTRTVNEINSLLEAPNRDGFHQVSVQTEQKTFPKVQEKKELSASGFVALIEQILRTCYATNTLKVTNEDVSQDPAVIQKKFDEAVSKAMGRVTLETFIERIYVELLFSFTNKTTQNILNRLIGRAIGMKYPLLKGKFLHCFKNKRNGPGETDRALVGKPSASTPSESQEKIKQIFVVVSKEVALSKPNFIISNCNVDPNANLVQTTNSIPSNLAAVAPIISEQGCRQQNSCGAETVPSRMAGESLLKQNNLPGSVNASKRSRPLEPFESNQSKSGTGQNKSNRSLSSTEMKSSNSATVVAESNKKKCIFGFNLNTDEKNNTVPSVPYQASVSSAAFRRAEELRVATVNPSVVQNLSSGNSQSASNESMQNISVCFSVNSQCQDKTNELISTPVSCLVPSSGPKTSVDAETPTANESRAADSSEESENSIEICHQSDDPGKGSPPVTKEKHFDEYKLKPCSVVLNADDVSNYFRLREMENEADSSSDVSNVSSFVFYRKNCRKRDSLSEDPDFCGPMSQKNIKRRKGISELEYMEARTRVLQRLRKRSAMYVGRRKSAKMTSDELDNFVIRRNSSVGRSPYVEDSTDDEDVAGEDGRTEGGEVSRMEEGEGSRMEGGGGSRTEGGGGSRTEGGEGSRTEEGEGSEAEEGEGSGVAQNEGSKKELRVMLVRLEDTPEYEKYKDILGLENKKSKMVRMGDKTDSYYEHILNKKKEYFEIRDGKLYLKEQYCVQDGVIVPAGGESSGVTSFKKEPRSTEDEGNYSTDFIKEENSAD